MLEKDFGSYASLHPQSTDSVNLDSLTNKIRKEIVNIAGSFLYIGFLLWECQTQKIYLERGYKNIYEYALSELGFKKSSTYNFINVCLRFSEYSGASPSYRLSLTYSKYSYSQLVELLSLTDEKISSVTPDMTVKEIKQMKNDSFQTSGKQIDIPVTKDMSIEELGLLFYSKFSEGYEAKIMFFKK